MIGAVTSVLVLGVFASIASAQNATGGKYDWRKYDNRLQAMVVRKVQIMEDGAKYNYNIARLFLLF